MAPHRHDGAFALMKMAFPWLNGRRLALGAAVFVLSLIGLSSPISPTALSWADASLRDGDPIEATLRYDNIAAWNPLRTHREAALYRSAKIWSLELGDSAQARMRLSTLAERSDDPTLRASVWEEIGHLFLNEERNPVAAASAYRMAFLASQDDPGAVNRLKLQASALAESGRMKESLRSWRRIGEKYPDQKGKSAIAMAQIRLSQGDAQGALSLYEDAIPLASSAADAELARLGATTCLETLGNLDQALAEFDQRDLPHDVREARQDGIRARMADGGSL